MKARERPGRRRQREIGGERIRLSVIVSRCRTRGNSLTAVGRRQQERRAGGVAREKEVGESIAAKTVRYIDRQIERGRER